MLQAERSVLADAETARANADAKATALSEANTAALAAAQAAQEAEERVNTLGSQLESTKGMLDAAIVSQAAAKMMPNQCPSTHPYAYLARENYAYCCRTRR